MAKYKQEQHYSKMHNRSNKNTALIDINMQQNGIVGMRGNNIKEAMSSNSSLSTQTPAEISC